MLKFLSHLFTKKAKTEGIQTAPLEGETILAVEKIRKFSPQQMKIGVGYSNGLQREHNEDSVFSLGSSMADINGEIRFGLFILADGMGGHSNGEIASSTAVRAFSSFMISKINSRFLGLSSESVEFSSMQELMEGALQEAQRSVVGKAPGGGTTLTAALVLGEQLTIAHVGDSRAYFLYPDGRFSLLTKDHSLVQRMVELGDLTEDEAKVHPNRNVLLRAVGQLEPFKPDIYSYPISGSGKLLICTDGLWGQVSEDNISKLLHTETDPALICQVLIQEANAAGGPDNISVIVVEFLN